MTIYNCNYYMNSKIYDAHSHINLEKYYSI